MVKKIPQKEIILKFVLKNPKLTSREIADQLKLNYNSIRGRVSDLKKNKLLLVNDNNEYTAVENWYKKLLKTGQTKNPIKSTSQNIEVYTYQIGDDDNMIMQQLLEAATNEIPDLEYIDDLGYTSISVESFEVEKQYQYPNAKLWVSGNRITVQLIWLN